MIQSRPQLIAHRGRLAWLFDDGKILPDISGAAEGEPPEKKFSQEDVDRIVQDRLARAKTDPPADYDDLKKAKQELDDLKAKDNTDLEKAQAEIAKLKTDNETSKLERDAAKVKADDVMKRSEFITAAAALGVKHPDQLWIVLPQSKKDAVTIGDDGQVTGADTVATESVADKSYAHFVGTPKGPKPDQAQGQRGDSTELGSAGKAEAQKRFGTPADTKTPAA